jgi:selenophosphate synthase
MADILHQKHSPTGNHPARHWTNRTSSSYSDRAGVLFSASLDEPDQMLLFDPQTSGGLLLGVPPGSLDSFLARMREIDQDSWVIGTAEKGTGIEIR